MTQEEAINEISKWANASHAYLSNREGYPRGYREGIAQAKVIILEFLSKIDVKQTKERKNMDKIIIEQTAGMWLFKITFLNVTNPIICNDLGFKDALRRFDQNKGIKSVKYLSGDKWLKMSKEKVRHHFSWDTETDLFLAQHYYFKQ